MKVPALSIVRCTLTLAWRSPVPVTLMLPVLLLVRVPLRERSLAVAIVIVPEFVTVPPRPLPTEVFATALRCR